MLGDKIQNKIFPKNEIKIFKYILKKCMYTISSLIVSETFNYAGYL